ncbi:MAG TPA: DUF4157 domain-containing protein, partial [Candidatus Sulfopaludibacter sp.]|nr:DUF4157 domain-containing protein [Candidatus Sulfopaludibacter sp.]
SARDIGAQAYTAGHHIVFAGGQYTPAQAEGRRLIAHELAHVVQQSSAGGPAPVVRRKSVKVAGCGLLNLAGSLTDIGSAAHVQIQAFLAAKGVAPEMGIPRATKTSLGVGCQKVGTPWGFADLARGGATGFELGEIKPVTMGGRALAKLEVAHYRRRATQSLQRLFKFGSCGRRGAGPDDLFFEAMNGLSVASSFSLLSGVLTGDTEIGPFSGDPSLTLKAKEVGPGAVGYWCTKGQQQQQNQPPKAPGPNVGVGVSVGGSAGGAYNAGVGISVQSDSTAYGTAGAGVSYQSDTKAAGAAGVGASSGTDSMAAGAAGAGASKDTQSAGAGVAGAGTSSDSVSAGAGVASAGSSKDSATAGAGVAGQGSVTDSSVAGAGSKGSGKVEGVIGAGTGSPKGPVDAKDVQGTGKAGGPTPAGAETKTGDQQPGGQPGGTAAKGSEAGSGSGQGGGAKTGGEGGGGSGAPGPAGAEGGAAKGAQRANQAGADKDTAGTSGGQTTQQGTSGTAGGQTAQATGGTGSGQTTQGAAGGTTGGAGGKLAAGPLPGPDASDADRQKAAEEASKVAALIEKASAAQLALLRHLAQTSQDGKYMVPTSEWVDTMMQATAGMSEEDIQYLKTLDWTPAKISPEELRKKLLEVLKDKKPAAKGDTSKGGGGGDTDKSKGEGGDGGSGSAGTGAAKSSSKGGSGKGGKGEGGPALSGFVQGRKYTGALTRFDDAGFQIQPSKEITPRTKKGAKATLEVRWREGGEVKRAKVEYEVVADPVVDTDPNTKKQMWHFDLKSTNTDPILLSPDDAEKPTVLPAQASAVYFIVKK